jgi:hypothetical protein
MAFNYYEGWSEKELLAERKLIQQQLSLGRTTEIRIAGELTRNDDRNAVPLDLTLTRLSYALYLINPDTYSNPYSSPATQQSHY